MDGAVAVKRARGSRPAEPYDGSVSRPSSSLLEDLRARDPDLLHNLVMQHARPLYRGARSLGFAQTDAEDLVQDVFVTFLQTLDRFEGRAQVGTWLFGILYRKGQERRRAGVRDDRHSTIDEAFEAQFDAAGSWSTPPPSAHRLLDSSQVGEALQACLADLPDLYRHVFHLRQVEEEPAADVGQILGCTINHVGVLLHRARVLVRRCLEGKGHGPVR